jgi:hypothetical protein
MGKADTGNRIPGQDLKPRNRKELACGLAGLTGFAGFSGFCGIFCINTAIMHRICFHAGHGHPFHRTIQLGQRNVRVPLKGHPEGKQQKEEYA